MSSTVARHDSANRNSEMTCLVETGDFPVNLASGWNQSLHALVVSVTADSRLGSKQ